MKIYIVEDDKNISEIEAYALKNSGYETEILENGEQFFEACREEIPGLVLLDVMLPGDDGLTILQKIRSQEDMKDIPVIMVTAKTTEIDKVKGLDMGADDYISKPFGVMELISRVKALLRRAGTEKNKKTSTKEYGMITIDEEKYIVKVLGEKCVLTHKEFELLKYLIANDGIVLSRNRIMDQVWGFDYEGESRTVDMHIKTLRKKLGPAGEMIKTVRNVGYKIEK